MIFTTVKTLNFVTMCKAYHSYLIVNMPLKNQNSIFHPLYSINLIKCGWPSPLGFWPCRGYSHTGWHTSGGSRCPTSSCPRGQWSPRPASGRSIWSKNMQCQQINTVEGMPSLITVRLVLYSVRDQYIERHYSSIVRRLRENPRYY